MIDKLKCNIAGLHIVVSFNGLSAESVNGIHNELASYATRSTEPVDLELELRAHDAGTRIRHNTNNDESQRVVFKHVGETVSIAGNGLDGLWTDAGNPRSTVFVIDSYCGIKSAMLSTLVYLGLQHGLLFVHASSAVISDKGCIFMGPSGVGKSTVAQELLRCGIQVLGDEMACIGTRQDGGSYLHQVPFGWAIPRLESSMNGSFSLSHIYYLDRRMMVGIHSIRRRDAARILLQNVMGIDIDGAELSMLIGVVDDVVSGIDIKAVSYNNTHSTIVDVIGNECIH